MVKEPVTEVDVEQPTKEEIAEFPQAPEDVPVVEDNKVEETEDAVQE